MGKKLPWLPQCIKSIRGYDQPVVIDYTKQLQDKALTQDLELETKKDSAIKRMQKKIEEIGKNLSKDLNKNSKKSKDLGR